MATDKQGALRFWCLLLFLTILSSTCAQSDIEQNALAQFYMGVTFGAAFNWNTGSPLCGQTGVTCISETVTKLLLNYKLTGGTISSFLGQLSNLQHLDLRGNGLNGTIPTEIGKLKKLQNMALTYNGLNGAIPTEFGQMTSLLNMALFSNRLNGTLPTELGLLKKLENMALDPNPLSGTIPTELGQMRSLTSLGLSGTSMSGTIPTELGQMAELKYLGLSETSLSGTIPTELGNLTKLTRLYLYSTSLSGTIPTELANTKNLQYMYLYSNSLSGTIPTQLGSLANLQFLLLSSNSLSGTIPTQIGNMANMISIYLQDNRLYGTIPSEFGVRKISDLLLGGTNHFCPLTDYSGWADSHDSPSNLTCAACGALFPLCQSGETCLGGVNQTFTCGVAGCPQQILHRYASWPQTAPGTTASGTCKQGYQGSPTRLCRADKTWETAVQNECTRSVCPTVEDGGYTWPSRQSGNIVNFLCPVGYSGRPTRTCLDPGVWSAIVNPCLEKACPAVASYQNAAWPLTSRGQVATGACAQGYSGTITRSCVVEGYWSPTVSGSCVRDKCPAEVAGNATWRATTAELTATGKCDAGFSGSPTRVCQADATWADIQNPCIRNQCPASAADGGTFGATDSLTIATGTCTLPFRGTPTRVCRAEGTWGSVISPCALDCPPSVYGRATWPTTLGSRYASGTCDAGFESSNGVPKRFCNADGTWSSSIVYVCLNKKCPSVEEGGVVWPSTSTFSTAAASCPSGRPLQARRRCNSDATWEPIMNPC